MDAMKLYKYHVDNHRRISHSLDVLENLIRESIATQDRDTYKALLPLYMLLLGACAEARLLKVLMEPKKFTQDEISQVLKSETHKDRWLELIKMSFLKREKRSITERITEQSLSRSAWHIYKDLENLIENELRIIIELRNKLAHGQFENPFANWSKPHLIREIKISQEHKRLFNTENLLTMILKRGIIDKLLDIIRDLGISEKAFPRDFDKYYKRISMARTHIKTKSYEKYENALINRHKRGLEIQNRNMKKNIWDKIFSWCRTCKGDRKFQKAG